MFIETIPRRGYRFLAPVQVLPNGSEHKAAEIAAPAAPDSTPHAAPTPIAPLEAAAPTNSRRLLRFGPMFAGLALAAVDIPAAWRLQHRSPQPMPRITDSTQLTFDGLSKGNLHAHGGYIYFNEQLSDRVTLVQVPIAGGIPKVLDASDDGLYLADVSSDGTKLLVLTPATTAKRSTARHGAGQRLDPRCRRSFSRRCILDARWKVSVTPSRSGCLRNGCRRLAPARRLFAAPGPVDGVRFFAEWLEDTDSRSAARSTPTTQCGKRAPMEATHTRS